MTFDFTIEKASQNGSFSIQGIKGNLVQGDALALLGPNGSGKSTLIKALSLFHPPQKGVISVSGEEIHNTIDSDKIGKPDNRIIYMSQDSDAWSTLSVEKNIAISPLVNSSTLEKLIDIFELDTLLPRRIWQLSGGERQRVNLIRALSVDAPVTLLDEPTSALSYSYAEVLEDYLLLKRKEGRIFVVITHSPGFCKDFSNKYLFLDQGTLVDSGATSDLEKSQNKSLQQWLNYQ